MRWKSKGEIEMDYTLFGEENDRWLPFIVMALFVIAVAAGALMGQSGA
ncbi:MAG TPA: hypothetical protein VGG64_01165 [Pirellulales bacterium]